MVLPQDDYHGFEHVTFAILQNRIATCDDLQALYTLSDRQKDGDRIGSNKYKRVSIYSFITLVGLT